MGLETLSEDVTDRYSQLGEECQISLDRETRNELAMLETALGPESTDTLLKRAIHLLFQNTVETGRMDFHLRGEYDVTYDEYLSGMTFDEMAPPSQFMQSDEPDDRRYQF